ncbi:MAG: B12-binding domain-containing radical SAM protein [Patescibacteria group bacterium]|nr:B12-binding domain-containing radical SAM protein [Patescibacteria group bacterium]
MKKEPKVLLIYPPTQLMDIETPRPDGSLGPLYLAGALENAGYQVDILDASVGPESANLKDTFYRSVKQANGLVRIGMTTEDIQEYIARGSYSVVGVSSNFTPQSNIALEIASAVKAVSRDILVLMGGVNARSLPERLLKTGNVDAICSTKGEKIIVNMIRAWIKGSDIAEVSGTITMRDGKVIRRCLAPDDVYQNLDELPFPTWEKLPFKHYDGIASSHAVLSIKPGRYGPIDTSSGCPFKCWYCHISKEKDHGDETGGIGSLRLKSVDRVMEEIHRLKDLGVSRLFFEDDSLLANKARVMDMFTRMREMGFSIGAINGVNLVHLQKKEAGRLVIDKEYLTLLRDCGFDQIVFPVESANQRILQKYATNKLNHATLDIYELVKIAAELNIVSPINMMIGFPDETEAEIMASIEMGKRIVEAGAPYCTFFIPIPFPGSELFDYAIRNGHLDSNFNPDIFNWKHAVCKNTTVAPERIVELRDWGWDYANSKQYIASRIEASAGHRWSSSATKLVSS